MINQADIIEIVAKHFDEKQTFCIVHAMTKAIEQGTADMATLKDLEVITSNQARVIAEGAAKQAETSSRNTYLLIAAFGTMATLAIAVATALKIWPL